MNFYEQQELARRNTRWLLVLFVLAVCALVLITLTFLTLFPWQTHAESFSSHGSNRPLMCLMTSGCNFGASVAEHSDKLLAVGIVLVLIIGGASLFKWLTLRKGGRIVAEMMGAEELQSNTFNTDEKRLLNVVEEMALAANMPVPAVYVMKGEMGINAFAAGFSPRDAVIAVTEGSLKTFTREQLQGVIGHEFSHILNGDMRLNMHMIAVLHGITFITEAGYVFLRSGRSSDRKNNGLVFMLGLGLVVIGSVGTLFGNMIKAAISRQREFLADASAVQFTRNPGAIADALKVIGGNSEGSYIHNGHSVEISHLFFGEALSRAHAFFATHPPLRQRIRRIEPRWNGEFIQAVYRAESTDQPVEEKPPINFEPAMAAFVAAAMVAESGQPPRFEPQETLHEPLGAAAAICCLLLPEDEKLNQPLLASIGRTWPELQQEITTSPWKNSPRQDFLPIVELSTSALRQLPLADYTRFKQCLLMLMKGDGVIDVYEWALYYLLKSSVDCHFGQAIIPRPRYKNIQELEQELHSIIGMVIQSTQQNDTCKARAYERAYAVCGMAMPAVATAPVSMADFTAAMKKLSNGYPLLKSRVMKALVDAAKSDGEVEVIERNVIKAIGAAIDTPIFNLEMPGLV